MVKHWQLAVLIIIPLLFFLSGALTLHDYGINWDESNHFSRGQAYLHYFLTGKTTYDDIPDWQRVAQNSGEVGLVDPILRRHRYSRFMVPSSPAAEFLKADAGHPPLNGILAAAFNRFFYGKLGLFGDLDSHHFFEITVSTGLVALVILWAYRVMGFWPAVISGVALATHPMFLGESRFNIKDPVEATFFTLTLFLLWHAVTKREPAREPRLLLWAGVAFGLALATKFNALFIIPIFVLWHVLELAIDPKWRTAIRNAFTWRVFAGYVGFAAIGVGILFVSWPYLWHDPINHLGKILGFYTHLGTGQHYNTAYLLPGGFNLYPLLDAIYRTPFITLTLATAGIVGMFSRLKEKHASAYLLWFLMLIVPIARVIAPNSSLYGATRQIMEHVPAMALLAGVGAQTIIDILARYKNKLLMGGFFLFTVLCYLLLAATLWRFHPNENLYLNSLIGGLPGAYAQNYPSWANTVGNGYEAGIEWLNVNAPHNSKLTLIYGLGSAIPPGRLRLDIKFSTRYYSGSLQEGEYIMEMLPLPDGYLAEYPERFLAPVYTYTVDGVSIVRIWKNDKEHQQGHWSVDPNPITVKDRFVVGPDLVIDLKKAYPLDHFSLEYDATVPGCEKLKEFALHIAGQDEKYVRKENIPYVHINRPQLAEKPFPDYFFAGQLTRYIKIASIDKDQERCLFNPTLIQVWQFQYK
ncbi:glycosyltransferase family 39 protein [Candidatus Berkelbacteria bacterium]|nr:glycosyltransferase family 39 protein [Candidatus Berkelbacteria bacterium]